MEEGRKEGTNGTSVTRGTAATAGSGAARARARGRCTTACSAGPSARPAAPGSVSSTLSTRQPYSRIYVKHTGAPRRPALSSAPSSVVSARVSSHTAAKQSSSSTIVLNPRRPQIEHDCTLSGGARTLSSGWERSGAESPNRLVTEASNFVRLNRLKSRLVLRKSWRSGRGFHFFSQSVAGGAPALLLNKPPTKHKPLELEKLGRVIACYRTLSRVIAVIASYRRPPHTQKPRG